MLFVISTKHQCTYTLNANNQQDLMYASLLPDGSYETSGSAYDLVKWNCLSDNHFKEAKRIHNLLLSEIK